MRRCHSDSDLILVRTQNYLLEKIKKNCLAQVQVIKYQKESIEKNKKQKLILKFKILIEKYYLRKKIKDLEVINEKLNIQISLLKNNINQIDDDQFISLDKNLICSITLEPFEDPVVASDGNTYENKAILEWFKKKKNFLSPLFGNYLRNQNLVPNINIKSLMESLKGKFNNLKLLNSLLIELETNKTILSNEIQRQKNVIKNLDLEIEKKSSNNGIINYIICCLPIKKSN